MCTEAQRSELYAAQIGPRKRDYYLKNFARFDESGGGFMPSWNWAALLFSAPWALYRKMYGVFFATGAVVVLWEMLAAGLRFSNMLGYPIYIALCVFFGLFGNALYYRHASKRIEKAYAQDSDLDRAALEAHLKGGVNTWVLPVFILGPFLAGVIAGVLTPAYQDYSIRAQVSLGLEDAADAMSAVEMHYGAMSLLPTDNASAGLPTAERMTGDYVSSVEVDHGAIVITYGNKAHQVIRGHTVALTLEVQPDDTLDWECESQTIRPMHLPAACRIRP